MKRMLIAIASVSVLALVLSGSILTGDEPKTQESPSLLQLQLAHAQLIAEFGPSHPQTVKVAKQIDKIQNALQAMKPVADERTADNEEQTILRELQKTVKELSERVTELEKEVAELKSPKARVFLLNK